MNTYVEEQKLERQQQQEERNTASNKVRRGWNTRREIKSLNVLIFWKKHKETSQRVLHAVSQFSSSNLSLSSCKNLDLGLIPQQCRHKVKGYLPVLFSRSVNHRWVKQSSNFYRIALLSTGANFEKITHFIPRTFLTNDGNRSCQVNSFTCGAGTALISSRWV